MNPNFLKLTTFLLLLTSIASSCNPECPPDCPDEYPQNISFTEYSLNETTCQWQNLPYDEKVIIINSSEELEKYITYTSNKPAIDFSKYTLLLTSGSSYSGIAEITAKNLQQLSAYNYKLNIEIAINDDIVTQQWVLALMVEKISEKSNIELNISINMQIDFNNIENLYAQPLEVIQKCVKEKWELIKCRRWGWPTAALMLPNNTIVNIDSENNNVAITMGEIYPLMSLMCGNLNGTSSCSWEKKEVYPPRYPYGNPNNPDTSYFTYVMLFDRLITNSTLVHYGIEKVGWYFESIKNDTLRVTTDAIPEGNKLFYERYWFLRIRD